MSRSFTRRLGVVVFLLSAVTVADARQQVRDAQAPGRPAPAATGVIAGTVVFEDGRPARRATVRLTSTNLGISFATNADAEGAFRFENLREASYTIRATKQGALESIYGQKTPGSGRPGTPIQLGNAQRLERVQLVMSRGAVLTGLVVDEFGDPAFGASVRAYRYALRSGARTLVSAGTALTDDRGIYRIPVLPGGEYVVMSAAREVATVEVMRQVEEELVSMREAMARLVLVRDGSSASIPPPPPPRPPAVVAGRSSVPTLSGPAEPADAYVPTFFPASSTPSSATSVTLIAGEERSGIDMQLRRVPVARISGTVIAPPGARLISEMQLIDRANPLPAQSSRMTLIQEDGRFTFTGIPAGEYTLLVFGSVPASGAASAPAPPPGADPAARERARAAAAAAQRETIYGMLDITTSGTPHENILLTLQPGATITGTVVFESDRPADLTHLTVRAVPAVTSGVSIDRPDLAAARLDANGRFTIRGVVPGQYRITAGSGFGTLLMKSAVFGGQDVLDLPLDITPGESSVSGAVTVTSRISELSGSLTDSAGAPSSGFTIVVFPSDSRFWTPDSRRIQATRPATDGRFSFRGLPAGEYRLVAVDDPEPGQWFASDFLKDLLPASVVVTLGDGEKKSQALRVGR